MSWLPKKNCSKRNITSQLFYPSIQKKKSGNNVHLNIKKKNRDMIIEYCFGKKLWRRRRYAAASSFTVHEKYNNIMAKGVSSIQWDNETIYWLISFNKILEFFNGSWFARFISHVMKALYFHKSFKMIYGKATA